MADIDWGELLDANLTRWERLEKWLFKHDTHTFTNQQIGANLKVTQTEASRLIQAYLNAQRAQNSSTMYVLKREGRTSSAIWSVGQRTADARVIGGMLFDDVSTKVKRAFKPDLERLATKNPQAAKYCEAKIDAVMDGALKVLAASVDSYLDEDDEA